MSLRALLFASCLACLGVFLAGCGGSSPGLLPVASPLVRYQAPAPEDLVEEEAVPPAATDVGDDWGGLDDDAEETPAGEP